MGWAKIYMLIGVIHSYDVSVQLIATPVADHCDNYMMTLDSSISAFVTLEMLPD